jgi:TfoX/Sxy family transcriptional regulator of competence genes
MPLLSAAVARTAGGHGTGSSWGKAPKELVDALARVTADLDVQERPMFGYPCYFVNGNMFLGAHQDGAVLRLGEDDRKEVLSSSGAFTRFEPLPGRVMKEYVVAPASVYRSESRFRELVQLSLAYARGLPPKQPHRSRMVRRRGDRDA